ncbi:hypothetical protein acdb102_02370 [Acidothermaceae bacterium B102]|nr:hypothetical protein acdb102_02370 [Acidothermaceae bacterium B102]
MTAALAALLLVLSPVGHAWAGNGDSRSVAQSQAAHHDEAVTTSTASRATGVGSHATDLALPGAAGISDPDVLAPPTRVAPDPVELAGTGAAPARAPPLKA